VSATRMSYVRGTRNISGHAYGLALDVLSVRGPRGMSYSVAEDFERNTGDYADCVGEPQAAGGMLLKTLVCRLQETGRFKNVLSPDFDGDHWNHLHLEARGPKAAARRVRPR
jgi:hypothetical protein